MSHQEFNRVVAAYKADPTPNWIAGAAARGPVPGAGTDVAACARQGGVCGAVSGDTRRLRPHPQRGGGAPLYPAAWATRSRPRLPDRNSATRSSATLWRTGASPSPCWSSATLPRRVRAPTPTSSRRSPQDGQYIFEGTPVRTTDREGKGTKDTRLGGRHRPLQPQPLRALTIVLILAFASRNSLRFSRPSATLFGRRFCLRRPHRCCAEASSVSREAALFYPGLRKSAGLPCADRQIHALGKAAVFAAALWEGPLAWTTRMRRHRHG